MSNKDLATKLLASGVLDNPEEYTLKDLFRIQDAEEILADYGLEDKDLLIEVRKFIAQKVE